MAERNLGQIIGVWIEDSTPPHEDVIWIRTINQGTGEKSVFIFNGTEWINIYRKVFKQSLTVPPNSNVPVEFSHPYGDDLPIYTLYKGGQEVDNKPTISQGSVYFGNIGTGSYTLVAYFI
ncbi:hypothetical protein WAF17_16460 [Bernardetia sp. ABR2-2B]|uniref:hypothetical protein n=1 Tax=Bernardetia sp. ABR2-2B TaxID=3127472 RepID=UPI0030CACB62